MGVVVLVKHQADRLGVGTGLVETPKEGQAAARPAYFVATRPVYTVVDGLPGQAPQSLLR